MPQTFFNKAWSGSHLQAIIYDSSGSKILGRGTNCQFQDNFTVLPVIEWGKNGIDEFVPTKMEGSGSLGTMFIPNIHDNMPTRDNFASLGPCMMQIVVAEGYPNAGTIMGQFSEVWFNQVGGGFADANSLATMNVNFVYGKRIPGASVQGMAYPVE
jgi:hypothetical protein